MPRLDVAPTKSNHLRLKRELEIVSEGYEHLDQKRKILTMELMRYLESAKRIQSESLAKLGQAYASLKRALLRNGQKKIKEKSLDIEYNHTIEVKAVQVVGLRIPTVFFKPDEFRVRYSLAQTSATFDEAMKHFLECLDVIARLAEIENAVLILAREVKRTQRRVNALEKIFMPSYQETIKFIEETLEGKDQETFYILKMVKNRIARETEGE